MVCPSSIALCNFFLPLKYLYFMVRSASELAANGLATDAMAMSPIITHIETSFRSPIPVRFPEVAAVVLMEVMALVEPVALVPWGGAGMTVSGDIVSITTFDSS